MLDAGVTNATSLEAVSGAKAGAKGTITYLEVT